MVEPVSPTASRTRSAIGVDRDVDSRRDVQHLAGDAVDRGRDDRLDRLGVVVDVQPVAARRAAAVDRQRQPLQRLRDEARHDLLRVLPRPVVVEGPDDDDRKVVRHEVAVREPVATRLRRRVGAARVERVLLVHRVALGGAVHLARGDEDEALDRVPAAPRRAGSACPRRSSSRTRRRRRRIDFSTCDSAAALTITSTCETTSSTSSRVADVAVDEREPLVAHHVCEVLEVARVREGVERDHLVRRAGQEVADEVRRDEPCPAGDEDALSTEASRETYPWVSRSIA